MYNMNTSRYIVTMHKVVVDKSVMKTLAIKVNRIELRIFEAIDRE